MSIPKKGPRKIIVDGVEYRWRVRWKPTYSQCVGETNLLATVELFENPQSVLSIDFSWVRFDSWLGFAEKPVTPKYIEECVKKALVEGWRPDKKETSKLRTNRQCKPKVFRIMLEF